MELSRRAVLAGGAGAAAALLSPGRLSAQTSPPIRRKIPSTGELVPTIGLGTARRWETVASDTELPPLRGALKTFQARGGTVIDTSPTYGTAEEVLGRLAQELGRDSFFLATKVSISGRDAGVQQIDRSFKALRTSRIDLIAVHNLRDTAIHLQTLRELKQSGKIRYIGVTTSFENQHEELANVMRRKTLDFAQVDFALDNRKAGERILPLAEERGIAVMINLPFGRGRLFSAVQGKPLPGWASEFDCESWAQFFLKYLLSFAAVTSPVPGMANPDYVTDNLGAMRGRLPDPAMRRRMESFIDSL